MARRNSITEFPLFSKACKSEVLEIEVLQPLLRNTQYEPASGTATGMTSDVHGCMRMHALARGGSAATADCESCHGKFGSLQPCNVFSAQSPACLSQALPFQALSGRLRESFL